MRSLIAGEMAGRTRRGRCQVDTIEHSGESMNSP